MFSWALKMHTPSRSCHEQHPQRLGFVPSMTSQSAESTPCQLRSRVWTWKSLWTSRCVFGTEAHSLSICEGRRAVPKRQAERCVRRPRLPMHSRRKVTVGRRWHNDAQAVSLSHLTRDWNLLWAHTSKEEKCQGTWNLKNILNSVVRKGIRRNARWSPWAVQASAPCAKDQSIQEKCCYFPQRVFPFEFKQFRAEGGDNRWIKVPSLSLEFLT